ncbi:hypothetical protein ABID37_005189, partial [Aquamicrobium terrae]
MTKLTKRTVDAAEIGASDYVIWDKDLPGFGLRVFTSGKRSYVVQYRQAGRSRRYTIGLHGVWTPETARREAKALLGQVARGGNPAEDRALDRQAITVKELCTRYLADLEKGLILGKRGRPKKASTVLTDMGRIQRHIIPLLGNRRVHDLTKSDITQTMKDIMAGKTRINEKTDKRGDRPRWGRYGDAHDRLLWRHSQLCGGVRHHRFRTLRMELASPRTMSVVVAWVRIPTASFAALAVWLLSFVWLQSAADAAPAIDGALLPFGHDLLASVEVDSLLQDLEPFVHGFEGAPLGGRHALDDVFFAAKDGIVAETLVKRPADGGELAADGRIERSGGDVEPAALLLHLGGELSQGILGRIRQSGDRNLHAAALFRNGLALGVDGGGPGCPERTQMCGRLRHGLQRCLPFPAG